MQFQIQTRVPRKLRHDSWNLILSGPGNNEGGFLYLDPVRGTTFELFFAKVFRTGPFFSIGDIANNPRLGTVRIDHSSIRNSRPVRLGDIVLVGPLTFHADGRVRAEMGWIVGADNPLAPHRRSGFISHVAAAGSFGKVTELGTGVDYFVHSTQLKDGLVFIVGSACTFIPSETHRGKEARDVRPVY